MAESVAEILKRGLAALPGVHPQDLVGVSEEDVRELDAYAGGQLPSVYREFLKELGHSAGTLFRGTEGLLGDRFRLRLREHADQLLKRMNAPFELPAGAFVFLMAQGYQFSYFRLGASDDPAVFHYLEGDAAPTKLADHLSEYFLRCLEACEKRAAAGVGTK